ncbi:MAG: hypothetical protein JXA90_15785 [Planctomycetes bacterium]|nr:hypothetical protein [Planctomycetota bacterium]
MARRPGLTTMPLSIVQSILRKERSDLSDVYAPLRDLAVEIANPALCGPERFQVQLRRGTSMQALRLTSTSLEQLCGIAGMPVNFLDRMPPSLGLSVLRSLLSAVDLAGNRPFLLRLKGRPPSLLRAVLPQSFVRIDDFEVYSAIVCAARETSLRVASLVVNEDLFFLRATFRKPLNLGSSRSPDEAFPGIDVVTSETGARPLEVRQCLLRVVCSNGVTYAEPGRRALRSGRTRVDRPVLEESLRSALESSMSSGPRIAGLLAESRSRFIPNPAEEIERILHRYRIGSSRGRIARWVSHELSRKVNLLGVEKFELIQAFSAVARGLEPSDRAKVEDAMGAYLLETTRKA